MMDKYDKLMLMIRVYFYWKDAEKRHPSCGFAPFRANAEKALRKKLKEHDTPAKGS